MSDETEQPEPDTEEVAARLVGEIGKYAELIIAAIEQKVDDRWADNFVPFADIERRILGCAMQLAAQGLLKQHGQFTCRDLSRDFRLVAIFAQGDYAEQLLQYVNDNPAEPTCQFRLNLGPTRLTRKTAEAAPEAQA